MFKIAACSYKLYLCTKLQYAYYTLQLNESKTDEEVQAIFTSESMIDFLDHAGVSLAVNVSIYLTVYSYISRYPLGTIIVVFRWWIKKYNSSTANCHTVSSR